MSVVAPVPRGTLGARMGRSAIDWIPPALVLVLGILLWEGLVRGLDVQRFLLPAPSAILDTLRAKAPTATIILMGIFPRNDNMAAMPVINRINENLARFATCSGRPGSIPSPRRSAAG